MSHIQIVELTYHRYPFITDNTIPISIVKEHIKARQQYYEELLKHELALNT